MPKFCHLTMTIRRYGSDSPWCEPNAPLFRDVFLVVFGDKKVSQNPESYVGICGSWLVQASNIHVTKHVFIMTESKKCTQTTK
jgi:hypothetical protein